MSNLETWLRSHRLFGAGNALPIEIGFALGLTAVTLAMGVLAGRFLGPRVTDLWRDHADGQGEGMRARLCAIVRHLVSALLLAILLHGHGWDSLAAAPIGFALGAAVAAAAFQMLRGAGIPRWMAWTVGAILFVALFSNAVGGLGPINRTLEAIGFDIGKRRFSVLSLITMTITAVALYAAVRLANRMVAQAIRHADGLDATQKLLGQKLAGIVVLVTAFFIGIDLLNIDLTAFAVFSGAFGLAVGFGLQKTFGNLIAGIILLMDRSIKPGDVIVVGDSFGWVNKIGVRAVSVITRDGKEHLIPNENLMTQEVENWSYSDRNVRVRIPVGVGYSSDLRLAQELMLRAAIESPRVLKTPKPNVWLADFGEYAVQHEILAWISDPEGGVGNVRSDVLNRLWWLFKEHGIEVPFPQRDIHIRSGRPPVADT
ncbi:hypothetical protein BH09PSE4_BH09PSE4_14120 [soil metagenome]